MLLCKHEVMHSPCQWEQQGGGKTQTPILMTSKSQPGVITIYVQYI